MRLYLSLIGLSLVLLGCQPAETPPGDAHGAAPNLASEAQSRLNASEGGRMVLRTITAHGGLDAWYNAPTSSYTWEYSNAGSNIRFKSLLVANNQTREVYHDLLELGTPDNPKPVQGQFAWDGKDAWISPDTLKQPNPRFWATTGYYFESIPFILADPGIDYEVMPDEMLNEKSYEMVKISYKDGVGDSSGDQYILYINKETSLVDAIRYTVTFGSGRPEAGAPLRQTLFYYEDYVEVDGLTVATRFRGFNYIDGQITTFKNEAWAADISFQKPFDRSRLVMPANGRIQPPPSSQE